MIDIEYEINCVGDHAISINMANRIDPTINKQVNLIAKKLIETELPGCISIVPAYHNLLLSFEPSRFNFAQLQATIKQIIDAMTDQDGAATRVLKIPVCYDQQFGLDLQAVANFAKTSVTDVIKLHTSRPYLIYFMGFLPGFAYMGSVDSQIAIPRRQSPRIKIDHGSVGIAGYQTGFYPVNAPGGWQIIGRTPLSLFDPSDPVLKYHAGDEIQFFPVDMAEYQAIQQADEHGEYQIEVVTHE